MSRSFSSETLFETALAPRDAVPLRPVPLSRRLMVAVVALALGLGAGLAAPARADGRDAVTAIAALAAVALIASQMGKAEEKKDKDKPKPKPAPVVKPVLPATCAIDIDSTEGKPARVFAESCLRERGFGYRLPPDCARDVRLFGKADRIYPAPCLDKAGFNTGSGPF